MNNLKKNGLLIVITTIALAMYFGFQPLFESTPGGIARELLVAALGAIFVLFTTVVVINQQADKQQELEKSDKLFERKLAVYSDAFDQAKRCIENQEISEADLVELRFIAHRLVTFVGIKSARIMIEIINFSNSLLTNQADGDEANYKLTRQDHHRLNELLLKFDLEARKDIGSHLDETDEELDDLQASMLSVIDESIELIEQRKTRNTQKETFKGQQFTKKEYVFQVLKNFISDQTVTFTEFEKWSRDPDLLQQIFGSAGDFATKNFTNARPFWIKLEDAEIMRAKSKEANWQRYWITADRVLTFPSGDQIVVRNGQSSEDVEVFKKWCANRQIPHA